MATIEEHLRDLRNHPEAWARNHAVQALSHHLDRPEVLEALIEALGDEDYHEVPEPGAPSFIYAVADEVRSALAPVAAANFQAIVSKMNSSPQAMLTGLWFMPSCGEGGLEVLEDALEHPNPDVPGRAATVLGTLLDKAEGESAIRLLQTYVRILVNRNVHARANAIDELRYFYKRNPQIDPVKALPPGFEAELAEAVRTRQTRPDAAWPYLASDLFLDACVEQTARGDDQSAYQLKAQIHRLDQAAIERLIKGVPTTGLIVLWGELGQKAAGAVPALLKLLQDPKQRSWAALALLRIPSGAKHVLPHMSDFFMAHEEIRASVMLHHREPAHFAAEIIPRLLDQWATISEECRRKGERAYTHQLAPLRGLKVLGPWMKGEMPWLLEQLEPSNSKSSARSYAVEILGSLGEDARPAFDKLAVLLEDTNERGTVLRILAQLGPIASDRFLPRLEALELESRGWRGWKKNWWTDPVAKAAKAVRGA